ncbi:Thiamine pyrophosphokinase [compost metagenome]
MALGDFDSVSPEERQLIRERSAAFLDCDPVAKDLTDTQWALDWALAQQPASLLLLGVTGTRFDHTLANIHLLVRAAQAQVPCRIVDPHNEISLLPEGGTLSLTKGHYEQVSLLPLSGTVTGITLDGFLYPLTNATISIGETIGISNVMLGGTATVRSTTGLLLVIQSRD